MSEEDDVAASQGRVLKAIALSGLIERDQQAVADQSRRETAMYFKQAARRRAEAAAMERLEKEWEVAPCPWCYRHAGVPKAGHGQLCAACHAIELNMSPLIHGGGMAGVDAVRVAANLRAAGYTIVPDRYRNGELIR